MALITAKYAGICGKCPEPIEKGQKIHYGGRGATSHEDCGPVTSAPSRGRTYYPRYRGRCEDAPCCGCCD